MHLGAVPREDRDRKAHLVKAWLQLSRVREAVRRVQGLPQVDAAPRGSAAAALHHSGVPDVRRIRLRRLLQVPEGLVHLHPSTPPPYQPLLACQFWMMSDRLCRSCTKSR